VRRFNFHLGKYVDCTEGTICEVCNGFGIAGITESIADILDKVPNETFCNRCDGTGVEPWIEKLTSKYTKRELEVLKDRALFNQGYPGKSKGL
jgi:DnaJ-class molecular chaperone